METIIRLSQNSFVLGMGWVLAYLFSACLVIALDSHTRIISRHPRVDRVLANLFVPAFVVLAVLMVILDSAARKPKS